MFCIKFKEISQLEIVVMVICYLVLAFFYIMVLGLMVFHSYLAVKNLTTCNIFWGLHNAGEHLSWKKVSYLRDFPQIIGSPFDQGWKANLKVFCRFRVKELTIWQFNSKINIKIGWSHYNLYELIDVTLCSSNTCPQKLPPSQIGWLVVCEEPKAKRYYDLLIIL